jgi:hypothetical protein
MGKAEGDVVEDKESEYFKMVKVQWLWGDFSSLHSRFYKVVMPKHICY